MGLNIVGVKIKAVDNFHAEVLYFALVLQISEKNPTVTMTLRLLKFRRW